VELENKRDVNPANVLIIGIGNLLLTDEGLGIHAVQELQKLPLPKDVEILDGGTGGFELISYFKGKKKIIFIDAFKADLPTGTILQSRLEDLNFEQELPLSVHQNGFQELLYHSRKLVPCPEIYLYGIVAGDYHSFSTSLTPEVHAHLPDLISMIMKDIKEERLGE
jgi:hydrogenase maturation protease